MILILERQSRIGVATIVISLTQISHRVMGLEMEKNTNQKYGEKCTQSAIESRAIDKANGRKNGVRIDVRLTGLNKTKGTCLKQAPF